MNGNLMNLKKAYNLYKEFKVFMESLGKGYEIPNNLKVELDCKKECIYVYENGEKYECDLREFISTIFDYIEGAEEALQHYEANYEYNEVLKGEMTEEDFIAKVGRIQLGILKLNHIKEEIEYLNKGYKIKKLFNIPEYTLSEEIQGLQSLGYLNEAQIKNMIDKHTCNVDEFSSKHDLELNLDSILNGNGPVITSYESPVNDEDIIIESVIKIVNGEAISYDTSVKLTCEYMGL